MLDKLKDILRNIDSFRLECSRHDCNYMIDFSELIEKDIGDIPISASTVDHGALYCPSCRRFDYKTRLMIIYTKYSWG